MTKDPVITIDCQLSCMQVSPKSYIQGCYAASSMHKTTITTTKTNKQTNKTSRKKTQIFCCMLLVALLPCPLAELHACIITHLNEMDIKVIVLICLVMSFTAKFAIHPDTSSLLSLLSLHVCRATLQMT